MELRQYWAIFQRWFWIPVGLALVAGALSIVLAPKAQTTYSSTLRANVSVPLEPRNPEKYSFEGYYAWVASEYLVDDLGELVRSRAFAEDVAKEIGDPTIGAASIQGSQATKRTHRLLSITVTGPDSNQVSKIANGIGKALQTQAPKYIAQLRLGNADIIVVDPPDLTSQTTGLRGNLDIIVRAALGFAAGLAIALLLNYLDTSIHTGGEAEKLLGVPVLGEIPVEKKRRRRFGSSAPAES